MLLVSGSVSKIPNHNREPTSILKEPHVQRHKAQLLFFKPPLFLGWELGTNNDFGEITHMIISGLDVITCHITIASSYFTKHSKDTNLGYVFVAGFLRSVP